MRAIPLRRLSASTVAFGTEFLVTHNSPEAMCDTQVVPFEMDLAVLSKDHAVTVASCGDTLTEIRYTTLKDATTRLLQRPVFFSVSKSVWEKGLPYTCKSVFCVYFSVFPDSVKVTLYASVRSFLSMYWVSATPLLWVLSVIVVPGAPSATTQTPRGMQNVS